MAKLLSAKCVASLRSKNLGMSSTAILNRNYSSKKVSSSDYLHQSVVPTMHYQKSLPRLPIPRLEDSIRRYLAAQRPLLDDNQFRATEKIAKDFLNGVGRQLQEELVAQDKINKHTSYSSGLCNDWHLDRRDPLLYQNPFGIYCSDPKAEYNEQLLRATNMLCSVVRFMKTLRAGILEPDIVHFKPTVSDTKLFKRLIRWVPPSLSWYGAQIVDAYPLDMSQYFYLFNTTRIPRQGRDEVFTDDKGQHVLVMRKGNMYVFDVVDRDGNLLKPTEIQSHLKYILSDPTPAPSFPVGVLTSENRDVWADLRDKLVDAGNTEVLQTVDSALFCLCLEDESMREDSYISKNILFGNGCNRWFDKSFSIILAKDGQAVSCFEHSWGDGTTMRRLHDEIFKDSTENPQVHPGSVAAAVDSASAVRRLQFNLSSELETGIKKAMENFDLAVSSLSIDFMDFKLGGKKLFKKYKLSTDAMAQLAFQMGFLRQYGQTVSTEEPCRTTMFKYGRLEVIRSATIFTKQCSHAFVCQPGQHTVEQLKTMLYQCSNYHRQLIEEATRGQGFDIHLCSLHRLAKSKGQTLHSLFTDPVSTSISQDILCISNLTSPTLRTGLTAPEARDGFGIIYCLHDNRVHGCITSFPTRNGHEFTQCIHRSLEDIVTVLEGKSHC